MHTRTIDTLYDYWNAIRGDRIAPRRFEIEPAQIVDLLPDTFILEFAEPSSFTYRLAGTRVCEILGRELRGESFLEGWQETDRFRLKRHLHSVQKLGAVTHLLTCGSQGSEDARFEAIIMPLRHHGEAIVRFLGGLVEISPRKSAEVQCAGELKVIETELTYPSDVYERESDGPPGIEERLEPPALATIRQARVVRQDRRQFRVYDGGLSDGET